MLLPNVRIYQFCANLYFTEPFSFIIIHIIIFSRSVLNMHGRHVNKMISNALGATM